MAAYLDELRRAMSLLADDPRTVFLGQAVACPGTFMSQTLADVPADKRVEMPVAEEMQMGATVGMAVAGLVPVSIYPRWNFLLLAANQLVNHLDKLPLYAGLSPRAIIRVGVGAKAPMWPGIQHVGDFTGAFESMLDTVRVERLVDAEDVVPAYRAALDADGATLLVEYAERYGA